MSWIIDSSYSWLQRLCINIIKSGDVPKHVAFIMDGNRRFAQKTKVQKAEGHSKGFDKLAETLQWCLDLGIPEVTVYAFSIENFKRNQEEVDTLMRLAKDKFKQLLYNERDQVMRNGVCIRVIGDLTLLDDELRNLIAQIMLLTKDNDRAYLNIAFAYTSREEMTVSIKTIVDAVENKKIDVTDVNEHLLSSCLYTNKSPNPDLLVRTSGEVRFSDFLLWQISATQVYFADVLWPEFNIWNMLGAIFFYQRQQSKINDIKKCQKVISDNNITSKNDRITKFLDELEEKRWSTLKSYVQV